MGSLYRALSNGWSPSTSTCEYGPLSSCGVQKWFLLALTLIGAALLLKAIKPPYIMFKKIPVWGLFDVRLV